MYLTQEAQGEGGQGGVGSADGAGMAQQNMSNIRIVRIVRITRLIRIFRITRIMRFVRALRTLVYSILCTLKSLIWAMLLLFLIMYVFGILFTQAVSDHLVQEGMFDDSSENPSSDMKAMYWHWGSLLLSMFTLFKAISGGISWGDAVHCLLEIGWTWLLLFIFFQAFAYFAVLNVVTGVFCQSAIESTQHDREMVVQAVLSNKTAYIKKIKQLFQGIDSDRDGLITIHEFEKHLQNPEVKAYFDSLELETTDAWTLFKLLDQDKTHVIDAEEFVMGCLRLKGAAKGIDIAKLMYENKILIKKMTAFMHMTDTQLDSLHRSVRQLSNTDADAEEHVSRSTVALSAACEVIALSSMVSERSDANSPPSERTSSEASPQPACTALSSLQLADEERVVGFKDNE